ncbi:snRNA-activating protein complex subunit 5 [Cuculus canorus]|uniref:snRNA-activating protein complex subunit 5 n=1 Tax=Cuculus canorus TaxID=55661 RepID=UPI0023AB24C4|nr:snRNA-activating protein complex subunit 5 [Cuculus canorus]
MLSRLQELRREEEALLRARAALREQLTRLRVEELALQAMMRSGEQSAPGAAARPEDRLETLGQMDNEAAINQTELHLSLQNQEDEEEEEEEESDS